MKEDQVPQYFKTKESRQTREMIIGKLPKYMKLTRNFRFTMSMSTMSTSTMSTMLLRNIAHHMMGLSSTSHLCICVFVFVFVIVFVISVRQWIVGVMSFQKIYDLIGLT